MDVQRFIVAVIQSTLTVYVRGLENPFNRWSDASYSQGFSWRKGSVSFLAPEDGDLPVAVGLEEAFVPRSDALRSIRVPFEVTGQGGIEVSGIYERKDRAVPIEKGQYSLFFECGILGGESGKSDEAPVWCELTFVRGGPAEPAILRQDDELNPPATLVMDGVPG